MKKLIKIPILGRIDDPKTVQKLMRMLPPKKKKKPSRKSLVKKLDQVVSLFTRTKTPYCVLCGSTEKLTNGHLFSRVAHSTRWLELNCHTSCWGCNFRHEFDFYPYQSWFVKTYGQQAYDDLYRRYRTPQKRSVSDLQELLEEWEQRLSSIQ